MIAKCCAILATFVALASGNALDDYISKIESVYQYHDTGFRGKTLTGADMYQLNVTSQDWANSSFATGPHGTSIWSHSVTVIIPKNVRIKDMAVAYLTGGCNSNPGVPKADDEEVLAVDLVAFNAGCAGIIVNQLPNCPIVFSADPSHRGRGEDAFCAWTWKSFFDTEDPIVLARFPMAKGGMQSMRAAQHFLNSVHDFEVDGWVVSGASKRGWTTWMVGAVNCTGENCVNIVAIAPLVPIVPALHKCVHRQYMSYHGWTFAFKDYTDVNLTTMLDSPQFANLLTLVDPINYAKRLARIPKFVVVSSDDEFMQMDWTNIWYDTFQQPEFGETHLLIVQDSEHSLATGIPEVVTSLTSAVQSIHKKEVRPTFNYSYDPSSGDLSVTIPPEHRDQLDSVNLWHTQTFSSERRDFRWVRMATNYSGACKLPEIKLKKTVFGGGNCIPLMVWKKEELKEAQPGVYGASPPVPKEGHWTGYYIEVHFKSGVKAPFMFSTPGFAWPNTLPFKDCHGADCRGVLL